MSPLRILALATLIAVVGAFNAAKSSCFLKNTALNANILDTAVSAGNFKRLIELVKIAGLADTLSKADSKLTLFAPTDEAFGNLPQDVLESLKRDPASLSKLLSFHVHPGVMNPTRTGRTLDTLMMGTDNFPKQLTIKVTNWECESFVFAGQEKPAKVTTMGIKCDNGLIHEITEVLLPYEGDLGPTVTFIGKGGITLEKTLQLSYYGPEEGKGRDLVKGDPNKVFEPISVGETWRRAGNWDNQLGYFDESVEYHNKKNAGEHLTEKK